MTGRLARVAAALLAALTLAGCGYLKSYAAQNPENPFTRIERVAVVPFWDLTGHDLMRQTDEGYDGEWIADQFASELAQFRGFAPPIRPRRVAAEIAAMGDRWTTGDVDGPGKAVELGRRLGADIVIVAAITEFDPYDRPRVGIAIQVFHTRASSGGLDISRLQQTGRPFPVGASAPGHVLASFEKIYDSSQRETFEMLKLYADWRHDTTDRGAEPEEVFYTDMPRYFRFVSNRAIRHFLDVAPAELKRTK